jgi:glycosyltransferase involved in cell wall biosynthesis
MEKNKTSIVIPYYNNHATIEDTINSIINQTHKNIEIIVVNDGSEIGSEVFLQNIGLKYNVSVLKQVNSGPSIARNLGAKNASGYYLLFLDADDVIEKTYIEKCISEFNQNGNLEIVYSKAKFFDLINKDWDLPELTFPKFLIDNCIHISALIKRHTFIQLGLFDVNINFTEDWELWMRIIKKHGVKSVYRIPETLFFYRKRKEKNSLSDLRDKDDNDIKCRLYIYNKHYDLYKKYNLDFITLITSVNDNLKYKRKYYNIWYKKLFYKLKG